MKTMSNNTKEERFRWIKPILDKEITIKYITKLSPFSEKTIKYCLAKYRKYGLGGGRKYRIRKFWHKFRQS